jgi:signal transduction histidine kinase
VEVAWQALPQQILIQVLDNGTGLASSANLFVPFYTTKPEGTGIGLILAQQIAHAHHGSVTLRNRPDPPGCVAEVILPR